MILTGSEIRRRHLAGQIAIEPWNEAQLGPNSYDLRLGDQLLTYSVAPYELDLANAAPTKVFPIPSEGFVLQPGTIYLAATAERTETHGLVPMIEGRSSIGRLGLFIHATAGFGDVGFSGHWTLELSCVQPVRIYAGVRICQIFYHEVCGEIAQTYQGKYSDSKHPRPSLIHREAPEFSPEKMKYPLMSSILHWPDA